MTDGFFGPVGDRRGGRLDVLWEGLLFSLLATALYWFTRSISLDDTDSVNLALGVREYNLALHQPHPPGAPVYVFVAKILHALGLSIPDALKLTAAFGGGLFVGAWYCIVADRFDRRAAFWLAAIVMLVPAQWMTATKAMTDSLAAGLFAVVIAFLASQSLSRSARTRLIGAAIVGALAIGVRPQLAAPVLLVLAAGTFMLRPPARALVWPGAAFAGVCLLWLGSAVFSQAMLPSNEHGWLNYFYQIAAYQDEYLSVENWSMAANELTPAFVLKQSIRHLGVMLYLGMGFNVWYPEAVNQMLVQLGSTGTPWVQDIREWHWAGTAFFALILTGWIRSLAQVTKRSLDQFFWFTAIWSIPYLAMTLYGVPPLTRFYVPLVPVLALPAVVGLLSLKWRNIAPLAATSCLVLSGTPLAKAQMNEPAPAIRLLEEVAARSGNSVSGRPTYLFVDGNVTGIARWYASDSYQVFDRDIGQSRRLPAEDLGRIQRLSAESVGRLLPSGEVYSNYRAGGSRLSFEEVERFSRSLRVWTRHNHVVLYRVRLPAPIPGG